MFEILKKFDHFNEKPALQTLSDIVKTMTDICKGPKIGK